MSVWTDLTYAFKSLLSSTKMTQLFENTKALGEGGTGAPKIQKNALDSGIVSAIKLEHSSGSISASLNPGEGRVVTMHHYSFFPNIYTEQGPGPSSLTIWGNVSDIVDLTGRFWMYNDTANTLHYSVRWHYILVT